MYNNYNYYPQQPNQQAVNYARPIVPLTLKGRPVSSLDEARASSIDFDGSIFYFPDLANKCIYTKQINMDGTATLNLYELKSIPLEPSSQSMTNYITREEFEQVITQLKQMLAPVQPITEPTPQKKMEVLSF